MGALPKRKTSKGRKNRRRAHHVEDLIKPSLVQEAKTGHIVQRHRLNPKTGEYKGRKIVNV